MIKFPDDNLSLTKTLDYHSQILTGIHFSGSNNFWGIESIGVRAILLPGGAVNHLPKRFLQVTQMFTKQSNRNEGLYDATT